MFLFLNNKKLNFFDEMNQVFKNSEIIDKNDPGFFDLQSSKFFCAIERKKPDTEIDEETISHNDFFKTEFFSQVKKSDFNINRICKTENYIDQDLKNEFPQKINKERKSNSSRKETSIIRLLYLNIGCKKKIMIFIKAFLIPHFIADILVIFISLSHMYYRQFCFMKPLCSCDGDLKIKLYTIANMVLSNHCLFNMGLYFCLVGVYLTDYRKLRIFVFFFYFTVCNTLETFFTFWSAEDTSYNEWTNHIIDFVASSLFLILIVSIKYHFNFKQILKALFKSSIFSFSLFFHYACIGFIFPSLDYQIPDHLSGYIIPLYKIFYFHFMNAAFYKFIHIYYYHINSLSKSVSPIVINLQIRFFQAFLLSFPLSSFINLKFEIQGIMKWVLLTSYINRLISMYTRVNLVRKYVYSPFLRKFFCRKTKQKEDDDCVCCKIISGNLFDILYIINMRMIFWMTFKIWIIQPFNLNYYENCGFEIDFSNFQISLLGVITIVTVNTLATFAVMVFMKINNQMLFEYKMNKDFISKLLNILCLLYLSVMIDNDMQTSFQR